MSVAAAVREKARATQLEEPEGRIHRVTGGEPATILQHVATDAGGIKKPDRQAGRSILFALPGAPTGVGRFKTHISCALSGGCFRYFAMRLAIGRMKGKSLTVFSVDGDAADWVRGAFLR
jgi:hypothetical protein